MALTFADSRRRAHIGRFWYMFRRSRRDDAPLPDAELAPAADADVEAETPVVLVTILKNADGSYLIVEGDEPVAPAAGEGEGMPALSAEAPAGKIVDSVGAALKAAMDILQHDAETEDGMSGQQQFEAGFKGGDTASPPKPKAPPAAA